MSRYPKILMLHNHDKVRTMLRRLLPVDAFKFIDVMKPEEALQKILLNEYDLLILGYQVENITIADFIQKVEQVNPKFFPPIVVLCSDDRVFDVELQNFRIKAVINLDTENEGEIAYEIKKCIKNNSNFFKRSLSNPITRKIVSNGKKERQTRTFGVEPQVVDIADPALSESKSTNKVKRRQGSPKTLLLNQTQILETLNKEVVAEEIACSILKDYSREVFAFRVQILSLFTRLPIKEPGKVTDQICGYLERFLYEITPNLPAVVKPEDDATKTTTTDKDIKLTGSLDFIGIPEILQVIKIQCLDGWMHVYNTKTSFKIAIKAGRISYISNESSKKENLLGEYLIKTGYVNRETLETLLSLYEGFIPLGEYLLENGVIDRTELANVVLEQAKHHFLKILDIKTGKFDFMTSNTEDCFQFQTPGISIDHLLLTTMQALDEEDED